MDSPSRCAGKWHRGIANHCPLLTALSPFASIRVISGFPILLLSIRELLIASHILPWHSHENERLIAACAL